MFYIYISRCNTCYKGGMARQRIEVFREKIRPHIPMKDALTEFRPRGRLTFYNHDYT